MDSSQKLSLNLPQPRQWVNEKIASALTGLSVHTLRAHRFKRTGIPYTKVGRSVRYCIEDVTAFMAAHRIVPER